jgi:hypothetical protein
MEGTSYNLFYFSITGVHYVVEWIEPTTEIEMDKSSKEFRTGLSVDFF